MTTIKLVEVCPVCGGWGLFLNQKCIECSGSGGKVLRITQETRDAYSRNAQLLSERETALFDWYSKGYSHREIAQNMDMPITKIIPLLFGIQKKLNEQVAPSGAEEIPQKEVGNGGETHWQDNAPV